MCYRALTCNVKIYGYIFLSCGNERKTKISYSLVFQKWKIYKYLWDVFLMLWTPLGLGRDSQGSIWGVGTQGDPLTNKLGAHILHPWKKHHWVWAPQNLCSLWNRILKYSTRMKDKIVLLVVVVKMNGSIKKITENMTPNRLKWKWIRTCGLPWLVCCGHIVSVCFGRFVAEVRLRFGHGTQLQ